MQKILSVFGTRPEAVKMAPVIKALEASPDAFQSVVCSTGQHAEMLDQILQVFDIKPDYDLRLMSAGQDLFDITSRVLIGMRDVIAIEKPDWILVHGDTNTTMAASLAAFYSRTKLAHVEAGLRTYQKHAPFPEEINRRIGDLLADLYFAPTESTRNNLLSEQVTPDRISVTGNTAIDALLWASDKMKEFNNPIPALDHLDWNRGTILVTAHRRENFGEGIENICLALLEITRLYPRMNIIFSVHLNPNIQSIVRKMLADTSNIALIPPQDYQHFVWPMNRAHIILTDSGGIQEEAPALKKPVLVMRDVTERPEGIASGVAKLVGTKPESIVRNVRNLIENEHVYLEMVQAINPYGDGTAALRILARLRASESSLQYA
ncbi:UDP-N-acetylglucosamine 2-epimerase (non-hydrolyzing) [Anaerolineales bacterium]